jgi:hypothetical protein
MVQKDKMKQRLYDMLLGFIGAVAVITVWGWISHKRNSFTDSLIVWKYLCLIIGFAFMWGRKLFHEPISRILSEDKRPPVLYLRSFKDDKTASAPMKQSYWPIFSTEEECLIDVLHDFGPCIAIGKPGEKLPDLGAARMYLDNNVWQDKVRELLMSSKLVVLRAGNTQNFLWEVEQSAESVRPKSVIILIPRVKNIYEDFRVRANQYFPKPLPESTKDFNFVSGIGSLHGFIYFDEDWTPHFIKFQNQLSFWASNIVDLPTYIIRNSLTPVYEYFGMSVPKPEGSSFGVVLATFLLSLLFQTILNR